MALFQVSQIAAAKRKKMNKTISALILLSATNSFSYAQESKSFDSIWSDYFKKSLHQKSLEQDKTANEEAYSRAKRHWLPRAYVAGQWFQTNDPTQVFFNHLGQRSIGMADFNPTQLNSPGMKNFKAATLGLDLPLYEGGMKSSQTSMYHSLVKSSEMELKAKKSEEYSELARQYGSVLIHEKNHKYLVDFKKNLQSIINRYQVGSQSNPVGYSGLLGLKGVGNRIEGMLSEYELKISSSKNWISSKVEIKENWTPETDQELQVFLNQNLSSSSAGAYSSQLLAQQLKVESLQDISKMEKARYLPRVGLFAQNNLYSGSRDNSSSQVYGVYLMWELFNSDSFGRVAEANAKAMAGKAKLDAFKQDERIMMQQLLDSKITLEKNLLLLEESDRLLKEQSQNAMTLFRSGMLNALQLAEVFNRRVDLIDNKMRAQSQYLDVTSRIYQIKN
jgi:hypothetical protein